jgi:hypothetical protein
MVNAKAAHHSSDSKPWNQNFIQSGSAIRKNAGSGSELNCCGSATLTHPLGKVPVTIVTVLPSLFLSLSSLARI